jgi:hypothetical protein
MRRRQNTSAGVLYPLTDVLRELPGKGWERHLEAIKDFEDAYQLVTEIENSETNVVFRFLVENFAADEEVRSFLRGQLGEHLGGLVKRLPAGCGSAQSRRAIKASP